MKNSPPVSIRFTPEQNVEDVVVNRHGRTLAMLGAGGPKRELDVASSFFANLQPTELPVLLGSGAGYCLEAVATYCERENLPLLVIDGEASILEATKLQELWNKPYITWITTADVGNASTMLTRWQTEHGGKALKGCVLPFYQRLNKEFFGQLRQYCEASAKVNIWERMRYPRFHNALPRILLLTSKYFLTGEITSACKRLGVPYEELVISSEETPLEGFVESLLEAITRFKPDFVFTINHLGVDREGVLVDLLERIELPLASWFVDNPMLILAMYNRLVSPMSSIFTWDHDNIAALKQLGFSHVEYLSLGTDTSRFAPPKPSWRPRAEWVADVSFVGNSMLHKVAARLEKITLPEALVTALHEVGAAFDASDERDIPAFLRKQFPQLHEAYETIEGAEGQLGYQAALTWEATRQYRLRCVSATFPFTPLIVGDSGWDSLVPSHVAWRKWSELSYYDELPQFYSCSKINFNCTSKQMKGAVNQRVFDVPAVGAFLLTDYREQIESLFEPGKEVVCYDSPEEAEDLIRFYLQHPAERQKVIDAGRARVLAEHCYDHRLRRIIELMAQQYG